MPRMTAITHAAERGGRTVIVSGTAVAIGFAAMLLVPVNEVQSIGIGGLLVTVVSVLVATTVLPLILVSLGSRVERVAAAAWNARPLGGDGLSGWGGTHSGFSPSPDCRCCCWHRRRHGYARICRVARGSRRMWTRFEY